MLTMKNKLDIEIERKQSEVAALESQLSKVRSYLHGLETARRLGALMEAPNAKGQLREKQPRQGSDVGKCMEMIRKAGHPIHINELVTGLGKESTKAARMSLSGSLSACVRDGKWFTKPEPNTFGLIEMNNPPSLNEDAFNVIQ